MKLPFELAIAIRYMTSRRKDAFVSLITMISIGGITVGVAALIIVLSVMNGFQDDLKQTILGTNAHIVVLRSGGAMAAHRILADQIVQDYENVEGITPFIYNQGMLTTDANVLGAVVRGLHLSTVTQVTEVRNYVTQGKLEDLRPQIDDAVVEVDHLEAASDATEGAGSTDAEEEDLRFIPGIALGKELAYNLGARVGTRVNLVSPNGEITPFGTAPRVREFMVRAIFTSGMYEYDNGLAYITLEEAQDFYSMGDSVTGLEIKIDDADNSTSISNRIAGQLGFPYYTRDWKELNKNLFGALQLEKLGMSIILVLIVMVAAFNIVSTLFMVVVDKAKDIAILMSMGANKKQIRRIFVFEGLVIGAVGATLGLILGGALVYVVDTYDLIQLPKDIYYIDRLPVKVVPLEIVMIYVGAIVISVAATLYPAYRAASIDPAEGIRYGAE